MLGRLAVGMPIVGLLTIAQLVTQEPKQPTITEVVSERQEQVIAQSTKQYNSSDVLVSYDVYQGYICTNEGHGVYGREYPSKSAPKLDLGFAEGQLVVFQKVYNSRWVLAYTDYSDGSWVQAFMDGQYLCDVQYIGDIRY